MPRREDLKKLKIKFSLQRKLQKVLIKSVIKKLLPTTDNKPKTNKKKRNTKLPVKELTKNTKLDKKLSELLWTQLPKLKRIHKMQLMLQGLLRLLITENQTTLKTKKIKLLRMPPKQKNLNRTKTKLQVSYKLPKKKQKIFNQPLTKLLIKKKKKVS